jgi:hypothetical protein
LDWQVIVDGQVKLACREGTGGDLVVKLQGTGFGCGPGRRGERYDQLVHVDCCGGFGCGEG